MYFLSAPSWVQSSSPLVWR